MASSGMEFTEAHSLFVDGDVGGELIDPAAGIEVVDTVMRASDGGVRVSAEDAVCVAGGGVVERAFGYLVGQTQPAGAEAIDSVGDGFVFGIEALELLVDTNAHAGEKVILRDEAIKLMAVHGDVAEALVLPDVALVDGDAGEVRHEVGEADVVIALNPDDLLAMARVGEAADLRKETPVIAGEAIEVKVGEDVPQKDELAEVGGLEQCERVGGAADFRAEVQIGEKKRIA